jgi:subtilase family serine protease
MARSFLVRVATSLVAASTAVTVTFSSGLATSVAGEARFSNPAAAVSGAVNDAVTVTLARDLPGALANSVDEGKLNDATPLPHITLTLTRPPQLQAALDKLVHDQHVRGSAGYRHWLLPSQLRAYGPAQSDIAAVTAWLGRQGLTVNSVSRSGMSIDFGGTAGKVAAAFHTQLHNVAYRGEAHVANITAPSIPAALAPVVTGVVLANFFPKPAMRKVTPSLTVTGGGATFYAVAPADFATIYNVNPLRGSNNFYGRPITGAGVTLAMVEQTMIQDKDWGHFRSAFGLTGYSGTLTQIHPGGCTSPGFTGDEGEAALDTEWSSAVAPAANIIEASCAGEAPFGFGVMMALQNLVEVGTKATIFSISYEGDEIADGFAFESAWTNLVEEGAVEGKSIFVASGDNGVSVEEGAIDKLGLFVNGLSDTPYNVAVGGTDFDDTALGENTTYWNPKNAMTGGSALSYIPEIPWNNSCASSVIWQFNKASGPIPFCNSGFKGPLQNDVGGSGSQSDFYTKPDWQSIGVLGVPNDGVRDQPDVSLFAANGIWAHFYVFCMSDANEGGKPCIYGTAKGVFGNAAGGTSFASPAFAGIAALVEETFEAPGQVFPLGNLAPTLYAVAKAQFTTPIGLSGCNASLGNKISPVCVFNYVTVGDNSEPCKAGTASCVAGGKPVGVLATTVDGKGVFAYPAQQGYSLATGLGSVNVTNLLYNYYVGL